MSPGKCRSWMVCAFACLLAAAPNNVRCTVARGELEMHPLGDYTLLATIEHDNAWAGCFRLPDQTLRLAVPGSYIGKNYGKIAKVDRGRVYIIELVPDGTGGWLERPNDLPAPPNPDRSVLRACRDASEADAAMHKRWAAEAVQFAVASRNVHAALLGWRWTTTQAPVVEVPKPSSWKKVVGIEHYGDGFVLVTRDSNSNGVTEPWHDGIYYLASPTASIERVRVMDCQILDDVVVRNGSAYWLCADGLKQWSLVTTKPNGERSTTALPLQADWLRFGLGVDGLLAISADTVWRKQAADWKVVFHSPSAKGSDGLIVDTGKREHADSTFLPQRSSTPFEHGGLLYFPTWTERNSGQLYRIALKNGSVIEESADFLTSHYFANWGSDVYSTAIDDSHALWLTGSLGAVFRIGAQGKVGLGSAWGDVAFQGPMQPNVEPDRPKNGTNLPTKAVLAEGKTLYLADDQALVEVTDGKVTPLARFAASDENCCECVCGFDPRILERFADGTFVLSQGDGGLYLLKKRGATWEFETPQLAQEYAEF